MFEFLDCILSRDYETDNKMLQAGSWGRLKRISSNYQIYLFGTGRACKIFINKYRKKLDIKGLYDNCQAKWGKDFEGLKIRNPEEIREKKNILIIITSTSYMDDIATQLDNMDFHNYYGLAVMESKKIVLRCVATVINFVLWKLVPIKRNRILITNGFRKYGDDLKPIVDQLIKEKIDCEILWMNPDPSSIYPKEVKLVSGGVVQKIIAHSTSKIWIDNYKKELWIQKKKSQFYINTWHGTIGLKKMDFDSPISSKRHLKRTVYDSKLIDLRISCGKQDTKTYREGMKYRGEILECGTPKQDILFLTEETFSVRKRLGIPKDAKIVLYAPTKRVSFDTGISYKTDIDLDFERVRLKLEQKFDGEFYMLLRLHPAAAKISIAENTHLRDVTKWEDAYEILRESDVLIGDYSGLLLDFGLTYKPIFRYVSDYDEYKKLPGVYIELDEAPFPYAYTQDELLNIIDNFDENDYLMRLRAFNDEIFWIAERGCASVQIVNRIKKYL